ncbi:MAG: M14 family zinc carboxypeptidase [Saprospiraceae bacterium]
MNNTDLKIGFEQNNNTTATYFESIAYYKLLDKNCDNIQVNAYGMTDSGYPLHEVIITNDGVFDPELIKKNGKSILFINNGIHPGEPCGVDASMLLTRALTQGNLQHLLNKVTIALVPLYNISGSLNRGSYSRANQNGPEEYGFRGNGQNLDLNRDFVKCDSENAKTFNRLYNKWSADIFIDNHTSNGADYQYVMTLIPTQKDKMEIPLSLYMTDHLLPDLYKKMKLNNYEMTPYVYAKTTPDQGILGFLDLPRYSSGYANLHNSISFMPETHMLKSYKDRVYSTYQFMISMLEHIDENKDALLSARQKAIQLTKTKQEFDINWKLDEKKSEKFLFKGYEAKYKPSDVSGIERLYYDQSKPYKKEISILNTYVPSLSVTKPKAYIIPRAYKQIIDKMISNGVEVMRINRDEVKEVETYQIIDFKTVKSPYEGHYLHSDLEITKRIENIKYLKGDYIIYTNQQMNRYIIETLEPQAPDSWFSWNFFDAILNQKEYFSPYVFEDLAKKILETNPTLKLKLEEKKAKNPEFKNSSYQQLEFVYQNSKYFEKTYRRYPIGRLLED